MGSLLKHLRNGLVATANLTLPQHCAICREPVPTGEHSRNGWPFAICGWCRASIPGTGIIRCSTCGLPGESTQPCAFCRRSPPAFTRTLVLADYAAPLDHLIRQFKYRQQIDLSQAFGQLLDAMIVGAGHSAGSSGALPLPAWPHSIVPVPLTTGRLRRRGFNQAGLLARDLSRRLKIRLAMRALRRLNNGDDDATSQTTKSRQARLREIAGQFKANASFSGQRLLLVDDVMTTGATTRAAAAALRDAGAASVTNIVIARTR